MVQNSSLPIAGDDGAEPIAHWPALSGPDALDVLIRVAPVLKYRCRQLAGNNRDLRQELLQEASYAVIRATADFNPDIGTLDGYAADRAVKHMRNVCRKHRRGRKLISYRDPHPHDDEPGFDPPDSTTEQCASCAADYERVRAVIPTALTRREQQIIQARYYRHLTVTQAARRFRLTKGRVSQLESAALLKLRLALENPITSLN